MVPTAFQPMLEMIGPALGLQQGDEQLGVAPLDAARALIVGGAHHAHGARGPGAGDRASAAIGEQGADLGCHPSKWTRKRPSPHHLPS